MIIASKGEALKPMVWYLLVARVVVSALVYQGRLGGEQSFFM